MFAAGGASHLPRRLLHANRAASRVVFRAAMAAMNYSLKIRDSRHSIWSSQQAAQQCRRDLAHRAGT